ncbi:hypothetical protein M513_08488 [Trichuris suis]|uniref:Uncharacterized protein n=1 Tax=Trichuris suis TaxID=68888 RepID=A0A085M0D5_9BILA|nr:hypothetical protein M513_08488 [Trichuris suis]
MLGSCTTMVRNARGVRLKKNAMFEKYPRFSRQQADNSAKANSYNGFFQICVNYWYDIGDKMLRNINSLYYEEGPAQTSRECRRVAATRAADKTYISLRLKWEQIRTAGTLPSKGGRGWPTFSGKERAFLGATGGILASGT